MTPSPSEQMHDLVSALLRRESQECDFQDASLAFLRKKLQHTQQQQAIIQPELDRRRAASIETLHDIGRHLDMGIDYRFVTVQIKQLCEAEKMMQRFFHGVPKKTEAALHAFQKKSGMSAQAAYTLVERAQQQMDACNQQDEFLQSEISGIAANIRQIEDSLHLHRQYRNGLDAWIRLKQEIVSP